MQDKIVVSSFWAAVLVTGTLLSPIITILINRGFDLIAKHLNNKHEKLLSLILEEGSYLNNIFKL